MNVRHRGTAQESYQINKTQFGIMTRDEKGTREISEGDIYQNRRRKNFFVTLIRARNEK